ncbi:hypothetical protein [Aliikangiella maris]|uniref:Uncharacterized protein n=2 Tax=Aliikangiella maris TaxID=3162458 RepID=A0ABV2BNP2_9GAMM
MKMITKVASVILFGLFSIGASAAENKGLVSISGDFMLAFFNVSANPEVGHENSMITAKVDDRKVMFIGRDEVRSASFYCVVRDGAALFEHAKSVVNGIGALTEVVIQKDSQGNCSYIESIKDSKFIF